MSDGEKEKKRVNCMWLRDTESSRSSQLKENSLFGFLFWAVGNLSFVRDASEREKVQKNAAGVSQQWDGKEGKGEQMKAVPLRQPGPSDSN